jgi:hypothetical protein
MKYLLLCYHDEATWQCAGETVHKNAMNEATRLVQDLQAKGQYLGAAPLQPIATAKSVRIRDGKQTATDGPFAETREVLGGFYLIDVSNLDVAIEVAARTPGAKVGTIEIRPVLEIANLPRS